MHLVMPTIGDILFSIITAFILTYVIETARKVKQIKRIKRKMASVPDLDAVDTGQIFEYTVYSEGRVIKRFSDKCYDVDELVAWATRKLGFEAAMRCEVHVKMREPKDREI